MHIHSEYDRLHGIGRRAVWTAARAVLLALLLAGLGSVYRPPSALSAVPMRSDAPQSLEVYVFSLSGAAESPPNSSTASGKGTVTLDLNTSMMTVAVQFSGLSSGTTAAHIHSATALPYQGTAIVATTTPTFPGFPLGVTSGTYTQSFDMTQTSSYSSSFLSANGGTATAAFAALRAGMQGGRAYFNIHTTNFPGGEIRGFLYALKVFLPLIRR